MEAKKEEPGREGIPRREENCPSAGENKPEEVKKEEPGREEIPRREANCPFAGEINRKKPSRWKSRRKSRDCGRIPCMIAW